MGARTGIAATLSADRQMFDRMLNNLLSNADKFTPDGGTIVVRTQNGPADRRNGPRSEPLCDL